MEITSSRLHLARYPLIPLFRTQLRANMRLVNTVECGRREMDGIWLHLLVIKMSIKYPMKGLSRTGQR